MLHEQIKRDITEAMKSGDKEKLRAARNLLSAMTNELVAKRRKPSELLDDEGAFAVVKRMANQRKESITQFREGGREDLVKSEEEELAYLEAYLPKMMEAGDIRKIVEAKKQGLGISDKSGAGKLMGAVMTEFKGKADGKTVKEIVDSLLS